MAKGLGVIDSGDFQELTMRFVVATAFARKALGQRFISLNQESVLEQGTAEINPRLRKTMLIGDLQMDPIRKAEESMMFLGERFLAADRVLNGDATLIATHLQTVVDEMNHLKPYFGPGSGYEETARAEVIAKIDAFLDTAQRLGVTPKEASRATRKGGP